MGAIMLSLNPPHSVTERPAPGNPLFSAPLQATPPSHSDSDDNHLRMVEMCNHHPMFQFLFDEGGKLLTANKWAINNMSGE